MDTVFLLLRNRRDFYLLKEYLADKYKIFSFLENDAFFENYDLCIADGYSLNKYKNEI